LAERRLLIVEVAGLGHDLVAREAGEEWLGLAVRRAEGVFPAMTCPFQATLRTAAPPSHHGIVFNGVFSRRLRRAFFWEQSSVVVEGSRIWEGFRAAGKRVGMVFWQQSLGEGVDLLLSPAPIHKHHGGMIDAVYSRPPRLYEELVRRLGRRFKLSSYWGPLASRASSEWIAEATSAIVADRELAPDLLLTYLPHLDYALLRHGPSGRHASRAFGELTAMVESLIGTARSNGFEVLVVGDYAFGDVRRVVFPNRLLRRESLLAVRQVGRRLYPDFHYSRALAIVDHEVAHVYLREPSDVGPVADLFRGADGIGEVLTGEELVGRGIGHPNCGEIVLVARDGCWFAYPWWERSGEQPDYAAHVDIHNKPGFDPCELFFGWPPLTVSTNPDKVRGSHGRLRPAAWVSTLDLDPPGPGLLDLAVAVKNLLAGEK